jgi:large subunit ribosomal protein L25
METQERPVLGVHVRERTGKGSARRLRDSGKIPGVCYGGGDDALSLTIDPGELRELLDNPRGRNTIFELDVDGERTIEPVMLKDFQREPVQRTLLHVDFQIVDLQKPVVVEVPLVPTGRARGVREGGKLTIVRPEIKVRALPGAIPDKIEIDVTDLGPAETYMMSDIEFPEGVKPTARGDYSVITIVMPRVEEEEELLEELEGEEGEGEEGEGEEGEGEEGEGEGAEE